MKKILPGRVAKRKMTEEEERIRERKEDCGGKCYNEMEQGKQMKMEGKIGNI